MLRLQTSQRRATSNSRHSRRRLPPLFWRYVHANRKHHHYKDTPQQYNIHRLYTLLHSWHKGFLFKLWLWRIRMPLHRQSSHALRICTRLRSIIVIKNGKVLTEIRKGMYGLQQAGKIANDDLKNASCLMDMHLLKTPPGYSGTWPRSSSMTSE